MSYQVIMKATPHSRKVYKLAEKQHIKIEKIARLKSGLQIEFSVVGATGKTVRANHFIKSIGALEWELSNDRVGSAHKLDSEYIYNAKLERVVDGDTLIVKIDLGFNVELSGITLRLARVDAPEMRGITRIDGVKAQNYLENMIKGKSLLVQTRKTGKYGRYIAEVWVKVKGLPVNVNDRMLKSRYAEPYT